MIQTLNNKRTSISIALKTILLKKTQLKKKTKKNKNKIIKSLNPSFEILSLIEQENEILVWGNHKISLGNQNINYRIQGIKFKMIKKISEEIRYWKIPFIRTLIQIELDNKV